MLCQQRFILSPEAFFYAKPNGMNYRMVIFVALLSGLALSACGFQPLYGEKSTANAVLDNIWIETIDNASGVTLRNELIDRFYRNGYPQNPAYILSIRLTEGYRDLDIREDDTTTRAQLIQRASYQLKNRDSNAVLFEETARAVNSYNILASQLTTTVAAQEARERGLRDIADKIQNRLAIYLSQSY